MAGELQNLYQASAQYTITLTQLASSSSIVAGRESTEITNTLNTDYIISGKVTTGTTVTAAAILVKLWGTMDDTPTRPDLGAGTPLTGADAAATWSSADIRDSGTWTLGAVQADTTNSRTYPFRAVSMRRIMGCVPNRHGLWIGHATVATLHATATNHRWSYTAIRGQYT